MAALEVEGLTKDYGRFRAVQDVSFSVETGDVFGLIGPNGSGKTTTLNCALGLLRHDAGRIRVLGQPSATIEKTRGRVAVVFDAPTLVDGLTCRQNLQYTRRVLGHTGGRSDDEVLELTGIAPLGSRRAGRLSLGQRRRLSIARALIGKPELLVLDEPLSGLDTVGVRAMLELFRTLHRDGLTLILSSHRLFEMETIVNRVGVLLEGRMVRAGDLDSVLQGSRARLRVRATPTDQAQAVLAGMDGIDAIERRKDEELIVQPGSVDPAAINRALHEAGCAVAAFVPERATLQAAFESLVDETLEAS